MKNIFNLNEYKLKKTREKLADAGFTITYELIVINECVEYRNGIDYCPVHQWYMKDGCPFVNKRECDIYAEMCGKR
jgi:hypothetical protein